MLSTPLDRDPAWHPGIRVLLRAMFENAGIRPHNAPGYVDFVHIACVCICGIKSKSSGGTVKLNCKSAENNNTTNGGAYVRTSGRRQVDSARIRPPRWRRTIVCALHSLSPLLPVPEHAANELGNLQFNTSKPWPRRPLGRTPVRPAQVSYESTSCSRLSAM